MIDAYVEQAGAITLASSLTPGVLAAVAGAAFLAAACLALTAFGFALVMVPLLSLAWDVKPAVVTSSLLGTILMIPLFYEARGRVPVSNVTPIVIGSFAGVPLGLLVLERIEPSALQVLVAAVVIVAAPALYFSPQFKLRRPLLLPSLLLGGLSGFLRSTTAIPGPPIVLYALSFERDIERFRATLLGIFLPMGLVTVAGLAIARLIDRDVVIASAVALPALVLGSATGAWLRRHVSEAVFRTIIFVILIVSGIAVLVSVAS